MYERPFPRVMHPRRDGLLAAARVAFNEHSDTIAGWIATIGVRFRFESSERRDGDIRDSTELWEALATRGVIPESWVDDTRRRLDAGGVHLRVALASDVHGVLAAEALAREFVSRMARWGMPQPDVVSWSLAMDGLAAAQSKRLLRHVPTAVGFRDDGHPAWHYNWRIFREWARSVGEHWEYACAQGHRVMDAASPDAYGRLFRDLPNPMEPLLDLWDGGYAMSIVSETTIGLLCPRID